MARISRRDTVRLRQPKNLGAQEGFATDTLTFSRPPKGLDYLDPLTSIPKEYTPQNMNLFLDRGKYRSRYGTTDVGGSVPNLMATLNFIDGNGVGYLVRFTTTKMQSFGGGAWTDVFTGFTGSTSDKFTFTAFGNKLLISNGVDGIFEYDFVGGVLKKLDGAPACKQLSTFDGRVIASNVIDPPTGALKASRVVWSVKDNELIWPDSSGFTDNDKIGSGFEDLLNTPGGQIDIALGVWPVTDTIALLVRSKSVWQVTATGNVDAPFSFDRLYDGIGCEAPQTIDTVPGGIIGQFTDDIYMLSNTEIKSIGGRVKDQILAETFVPKDTCGMYDPVTKNYWISNQSFTYRYSFIDDGWAKQHFPFTIRQMMHTRSSSSGLAIAQLVGPISGLVGAIKDLVGTSAIIGNFFTTTTGYTIQEDPTTTSDSDGNGGRVASTLELWTTPVIFGSILQRNRVLQIQLECEVQEAQTINFDYSFDGGAHWTAYSTLALGLTTNPTLVPFRHTIEGKVALLRLTSPSLGKLEIISLTAFGQQGALINL